MHEDMWWPRVVDVDRDHSTAWKLLEMRGNAWKSRRLGWGTFVGELPLKKIWSPMSSDLMDRIC